MKAFIRHLPLMGRVYEETVELPVPFDLIAPRFSDLAGTVLLMSGTDLDCARYHILAIDPWLTLKAKGRNITIETMGKSASFEGDPFDCLDAVLDHFAMDPSCTTSPVAAGLFGYLSYDLKQNIENLPVTCMDQNLPDLCLYAPTTILVHDKTRKVTTLFISLTVSGDGEKSHDKRIEEVRKSFLGRLVPFERPHGDNGFHLGGKGFRSNFSKPSYIASVSKIIEYIKAGDIYQVNLSQRFEAEFGGNAFALFQELFKKNPAPFFAFVNAGDHKIVSTSPERFISQQGRRVETRPIKGTFPRGKTAEEDLCLQTGLKDSLKDDAELSMIVDLMRNDLGKVAIGGSVRVVEHKRLEPYANVFHLVSIVTAELAPGKSSVDLLRATFPGGSITGCPKVRSMEIIDELETINRHVYTGSIGYLSFHNTLDLSIAIRTATIFNNTLSFSVGGGIVYDSDPEKEFQETLHKGKTLMETLEQGARSRQTPRPYAWVCGELILEDEANVPAHSPGFQYGAGIFETIRIEDGKALLFEEHLARFNGSWQNLFKIPMPHITWSEVLQQLVRINGFHKGLFAFKIIGADKGSGEAFLAAFIRPYIHRLEACGKQGIDLVTYPYPRQTPLADHKSLNYHFYLQAGLYAKETGADEALILNPDLTVSETNTCSIMVVGEKTVTLPLSDHVLPGVTRKVLVKLLQKQGYSIVQKKIKPCELGAGVVLTNSLMGAVPLLSLDGRVFEPAIGFCERFNLLLGMGALCQ